MTSLARCPQSSLCPSTSARFSFWSLVTAQPIYLTMPFANLKIHGGVGGGGGGNHPWIRRLHWWEVRLSILVSPDILLNAHSYSLVELQHSFCHSWAVCLYNCPFQMPWNLQQIPLATVMLSFARCPLIYKLPNPTRSPILPLLFFTIVCQPLFSHPDNSHLDLCRNFPLTTSSNMIRCLSIHSKQSGGGKWVQLKQYWL